MKHLHLRFITASLAIGLGFFNLLIVVWQAKMLTAPNIQVSPWLWLQAGAWLIVGSTLICYGWHEVRSEIMHQH